MRQLIAVALFCIGLFCIAQAQVPMTGAGLGAPSSGGACSQYTTLFAATSGWNSTHQTASQTLICGMVNQSSTISGTLFSRMDFFYVYATNSSANALINWVNPGTFNGTANGSPTFTADAGFQGADSTNTEYVDSGFNPTTGTPQFSTNSAHLSSWIADNLQSGAAGGASIGLHTTGTNDSSILPRYNDGNAYFRINDGTDSGGTTSSNSMGYWVASRTGASLSKGYRNGSVFATPNQAAGTLVSGNIFSMAVNNGSGSPVVSSGNQIMVTSAGAGFSDTDVSNLCTLIGAYLHTINGLTSPC